MEKARPLCIPEVRKLSTAAETMANKFLKENGLTSFRSIALFLFLQNRTEKKKLMTQRDLERAVGMSNPAVAGAVSRLEGKGFSGALQIRKGRRQPF